ncbi:MAG: glycosyltransferase [Gammaproteobacteria bacterium]
MPEVLMVAYDFPPGGGIGAGLRSLKFARYLPDYGWRPRIVSRADTVGDELAGFDVERVASWTPWQWPYEMRPYGWALAVANRMRRLARSADLVYVSCPPYPAALLLARLIDKGRLNVPLVVDFRDAWSLDPYQEGSALKRWLYRHVFPGWERRMLRHTDLLLTNTPSMLKAYQALYPAHAERMAWLPNGYDETDFRSCSGPADAGGPMTLLYAGSFGIGARDPANLVRGVQIARDGGCDVTLEIVGRQPPAVVSLLSRYAAGDGVRWIPGLPHGDMIARLCAADALVLIQAPVPAALLADGPAGQPVQAVAGKTYEYLRSGRPVLAITPAGDNRDLVRDWCPGAVFPEDDPAAIAAAVVRLCQVRRGDNGAAVRAPADAFARQYERRELTRQLAGHFDRLIGRAGGSDVRAGAGMATGDSD